VTSRVSLSKKIRFNIFKRDCFKCRYCGRTVGPDLMLEVDHVVPVSKGGTNDPINLVTACFDCNRGKSKNLLGTNSIGPLDAKSLKENIKEQKKQVLEYFKYIDQKKILRKELCEKAVMKMILFGPSFVPNDFIQGVSYFLTKLDLIEVQDASMIAINRFQARKTNDLWKYFYGICHTKIRNKEVEKNAKI